MARTLRRQGRTRDFDDFLRDTFSTPPTLPPDAFCAMVPANLDSAARTFIQQTIARLSFVPEDIRHQLLIGFTQGQSAPPLIVALPPYLLQQLKEQGWPIDEAASRDAFKAMVDIDHYERRSHDFDQIISATHDQFWGPNDTTYVDFDQPFDMDKEYLMSPERIQELSGSVLLWLDEG